MLYQKIEERLRAAVADVLPEVDGTSVTVQPCPEPKFGDYQSISLMAIAKARKANPRQLAQQVLAKLDVAAWSEPPEIAGAGFLNFRLRPPAIAGVLQSAWRGEHLFYSRSARPRTIVVDFSSPNVAKAMHVGHIRSTILGDALSRVLRLLGHRVVTDNHVGDWGTQFGKLLVAWKSDLDRAALERDPLAEMERLYKKANAEFEASEEAAARARQELVYLQSGDPQNLAIWKEMIDLSLREFDKTYARLGVKFDHVLGESFYNPALKELVQRLVGAGLARESDGAIAVFFEDIPELKDHPALIQKSDGGANYTTTDLATLEYRMKTWSPDEIVYVTDGRQQLHFRQLFAIFRRWMPQAHIQLSHVWFGMILGPDGTPFKTRSGETVKLSDLLDEACERALAIAKEKNPDLPTGEQEEIARIIGLAAVKYSDLLPNRQSDYTFSWEKMLALNGNTAPYLLYARTRTLSLARKAREEGLDLPGVEPAFHLNDAAEIALAKHLLNFGIVLQAVAGEYRPNYLCNYLYDLAGLLARFWEACPVLKAESARRADRLALCDLAGRVLQEGLNALGIETADKM